MNKKIHWILFLFLGVIGGVYGLVLTTGQPAHSNVQVGRVGTDSSANYQERSLSADVVVTGADNIIIDKLGTPLSTTTGFFVYTPNEVATACYRVFTSSDDLVTTTAAFHRSGQTFLTWEELATSTDYTIFRGDCPIAGSTEVSETDDDPAPLLVRKEGLGYVYTLFMDQNNWNTRAMGHQAHSFVFAFPEGHVSSTPAALTIHMDGLSTRYSFRTTSQITNSAYLRIDDYPIGGAMPDTANTFDYAYERNHSSQGWYFGHPCDGEDPANGVCNYIEHYILRAVQDITQLYSDDLDSDRVYSYGHSMGGTGSMRMGIRYPHVFTGSHASNGVTNFLTLDDLGGNDFVTGLLDNWGPTTSASSAPFQAVGLTSSTMARYNGDSPWDVQNMLTHVCTYRDEDTAFLGFSHRVDDNTVDFDTQAVPFWEAMDGCRTRFSAVAETGSHTASQDGNSHNWFRSSQFNTLEWNTYPRGPFVAISNAPTTSVDDGGEIFQYNYYPQWSDSSASTSDFGTNIIDTTSTFQVDLRTVRELITGPDITAGPVINADVTPRRTINFNPTNGTLYYYSNRNQNSGNIVDTGTTTADIYDLVTVLQTPIQTTDINRLIITTNSSSLDNDSDGVFDPFDNCVNDANADQADSDSNGVGDVCDGNGNNFETYTLGASADTHVRGGFRSSFNYGLTDELRLQTANVFAASPTEYAIFRFPTSSLSSTHQVESASINFYISSRSNIATDPVGFSIYEVTCNWEEGTNEGSAPNPLGPVTFDDQPVVGNLITSTLVAGTSTEFDLSFNITPSYDKDAQYCVWFWPAVGGQEGFSDATTWQFYSREFNVEERTPRLIVEYSVLSTGPTIGFDQLASTVAESVGTVDLDFTLTTATTSSINIGYEVYSASTTATTDDDFTLLGTGTSTLSAGTTTGTVSVSVVNDLIAENSETIAIRFTTSTLGTISTASSTHLITVTDNDTAGVTISDAALSLTEVGFGDTATFTIQLATEPTSTVAISIASSSPNEFTLSSDTVSFTSSTWDTPQTITLTVVDDDIDEDEETVDLTFSISQETAIGYIDAEIDIATTTVTITDDDTRDISTVRANTNANSRFELYESVLNDSVDGIDYGVRLISEPTADVVLTVSTTIADQFTIATTTFTFTTENWNTSQYLQLTVIDDDIDEVSQQIVGLVFTASSTDPKYDGYSRTDNRVEVYDDDTSGVTITTSTNAITEGNDLTYTVVLDSEPTSTVDIIIANSDNTSLTINTTSIRFTSSTWDTAVTVTATAVQDVDSADETVALTHSVSSTDANYDALADQTYTVNVTDNDIPGVTISSAAISATEGGATGSFTVVLNTAPTNDVTVALSTANSEVSLSTSSITFTPAQFNNTTTVTVTATNDTDVEGDHTDTISFVVTSVDGDYDGVSVNDVTVNITDNDVSATVTDTTVTAVEGGANGSYGLVLDYEPTADVTVTLTETSDDFSISTSSIVFTAGDWNVTRTISVVAVDDAIVEDTETSTIAHTVASADARYNGLAVSPTVVTITDNDDPIVDFVVTSTIAGEAVTSPSLLIEMNTTSPFNVTVNYTVAAGTADLSGSDRDATISNGSVTIVAGSTTNTLDFTVIDDAFDEADNETLTITLASVTNGELGNTTTHLYTIQDNDAPPTISWSEASSSGAEGTSVKNFTVNLSTASRRDVAVAYAIYAPSTTATTGTDVVLAGTGTSTISAGSTSASIRLNIIDDGFIESNETVGLVISNPSNATLAAPTTTVYTIIDNDTAGITRSAASLTVDEGSTGTYTLVLTAVPTTSVTITLSSSADVTATVAPTTIVFTSSTWDTAQTVTVTGVDDEERLSNQSATISHVVTTTDANFVDVTIDDVSISIDDNDQSGGGAIGRVITRSSNSGNSGSSSNNGGGSSANAPQIIRATPAPQIIVEQSTDTPAPSAAEGVPVALEVREGTEPTNEPTPETIVPEASREVRKQNPAAAKKRLSRSFSSGRRTTVSVGGAVHSVTVREATAERITVLVESDPQEVTLSNGETKDIDTNNDGIIDLAVSYDGLNAEGEPNIVMENLTDVSEITEDGITINAGAFSTNSRLVTIQMNVANTALVSLSNDPSFNDAVFVPYQSAFLWELSEGNGVKTVYVRFRADNGATLDVSDTITLTDQAFDSIDDVAGITCPLSIGSVYKSPTDSAVYYVTQPRYANGTFKTSGSCTKRPFKKSHVYFTYFTSWDPVQVVEQNQLDSVPNDALGFMPLGPLYRPSYGALVKSVSDPKVYVLLNNKKQWITEASVFEALGYEWSWIEDVSEELLSSYPNGGEITETSVHPETTIIKYDNSSKVYQLHKDPENSDQLVKRWISSPEAFNRLNFRWDRIITVDRAEFYEDGENLN